MGYRLTVRLPQDLAAWLSEAAREMGVSRGWIVRTALEKRRNSSRYRFLRLAGSIAGPANLSSREGFSRK
jgi:predicted transcriptional regulator